MAINGRASVPISEFEKLERKLRFLEGKQEPKMEMIASLVRSIERAGGASGTIIKQVVDGMTVIELIDCLATNHVRFTYKGEMK